MTEDLIAFRPENRREGRVGAKEESRLRASGYLIARKEGEDDQGALICPSPFSCQYAVGEQHSRYSALAHMHVSFEAVRAGFLQMALSIPGVSDGGQVDAQICLRFSGMLFMIGCIDPPPSRSDFRRCRTHN